MRRVQAVEKAILDENVGSSPGFDPQLRNQGVIAHTSNSSGWKFKVSWVVVTQPLIPALGRQRQASL